MRYSLFAPRSWKGRSTSQARWRRTWTWWPSVQAGGLATRSVNILFQVCLLPSRLRAPVSLGDCAISRRAVINNAGQYLTGKQRVKLVARAVLKGEAGRARRIGNVE
jgi:hypothetical protein